VDITLVIELFIKDPSFFHPTGIPKYGGFSTPQDENAVLLRSK
jgi:hypothetical protein